MPVPRVKGTQMLGHEIRFATDRARRAGAPFKRSRRLAQGWGSPRNFGACQSDRQSEPINDRGEYNVTRSLGAVEEIQQIPDGAMRLNPMSQGLVAQDAIVVLATDLFAFNEPIGFQVGNDSLNGAFGDPDLLSDFTKDNEGVSREQHHDMRMIRQERPMGTRCHRRGRHRRRYRSTVSFCGRRTISGSSASTLRRGPRLGTVNVHEIDQSLNKESPADRRHSKPMGDNAIRSPAAGDDPFTCRWKIRVINQRHASREYTIATLYSQHRLRPSDHRYPLVSRQLTCCFTTRNLNVFVMQRDPRLKSVRRRNCGHDDVRKDQFDDHLPYCDAGECRPNWQKAEDLEPQRTQRSQRQKDRDLMPLSVFLSAFLGGLCGSLSDCFAGIRTTWISKDMGAAALPRTEGHQDSLMASGASIIHQIAEWKRSRQTCLAASSQQSRDSISRVVSSKVCQSFFSSLLTAFSPPFSGAGGTAAAAPSGAGVIGEGRFGSGAMFGVNWADPASAGYWNRVRPPPSA